MVPVVVSGRMMLLLSLILTSVFGKEWDVIYETTSICALKGSSVNMSCTYRYPQEYNLIDTYWIKKPDEGINSLKDYHEYKDRVEYIEDRQNKTAILRLHNVTENDEKEYCFRLITTTERQKWIGQEGIQLHVSALQVQAPQLVLENETVNLTCGTTCNLTDRFVWYKNGQALNFHSDVLQLQSARSDSGSYRCAVRGHEHLPSPAASLTVMYSPRNTSVSVSPSVIVEGDSVTLSCSSDSNPPAVNFSWFKEDQTSAVGSGQSFSISSFNSSFSGRFYCEAQNKYGSQRSASVSLSVKVVGRLVILYISIGVICGAAVIIMLLLIWRSRRMNKRNESQMDRSSPHHDRCEPVYENVKIDRKRL
ncbi:B-cell receptor CD22-like [Pseudorasbora parva]|uniref:B-cell receptor CD22-like n=1 Tax=Pseudorasbora parva TaxID=51549 RepID=UPI00351DB28B